MKKFCPIHGIIILALAQISNSFAQEVTIDLVKALGPIYQLNSNDNIELASMAESICAYYGFNKVSLQQLSPVRGILDSDGFKLVDESLFTLHVKNFCLFLNPLANLGMAFSTFCMWYSGITNINQLAYGLCSLAWVKSIKTRCYDGTLDLFFQKLKYIRTIGNYQKFEKLECCGKIENIPHLILLSAVANCEGLQLDFHVPTILLSDLNESTCAICRFSFDKDDLVAQHEGKHPFHAHCITKWQSNCPLCAKEVLLLDWLVNQVKLE